jgi:hypothetical protein
LAARMRIRFYTDANLPKAVAGQLRERDVDIIRCEDVSMKYAADEQHLEYATAQGCVVVSHDGDFLKLHTKWQAEGKAHQGIVYILPDKQGIIGVIVNELYFLHEAVLTGAAILEDDIRNQVLYVG